MRVPLLRDTVLLAARRIDVLVNNAGVYQFAPLEGSSDAMVRFQFEVNVSWA